MTRRTCLQNTGIAVEMESHALMAGLEHSQQAGANKKLAAQAAGRYPPCLSQTALAERAKRLARRANVGEVSPQLHDYLSKAVERHLSMLLQRAFAAAALREGDAQRCVHMTRVVVVDRCVAVQPTHPHTTPLCRRRAQHSELTADPRRGILQIQRREKTAADERRRAEEAEATDAARKGNKEQARALEEAAAVESAALAASKALGGGGGAMWASWGAGGAGVLCGDEVGRGVDGTS